MIFQMAFKLTQQVLVIFFLMGIGVWARKKRIVDLAAARMFCNFVLMLFIPALLIHTFSMQPPMSNPLLTILIGLVLSIVFHLIGIGLTRLLYPKLDDQTAVERMACICSNCGFMGIPLISAAIGNEGLIFAALYISIFNIYNWTHAVMMLKRKNRVNWKKALLSPGTLGAAAGIVVYLLHLRFPYSVAETIRMISDMNTPLPAILMGIFVADVDLREILSQLRVYKTAFLRLVGLPLLFLVFLWMIQFHTWFPGSARAAVVLMIACSCPSGVSVVLFPAKIGGGDEAYGGALIAVTSLLSIATIPLIAMLAGLVFGGI